MIWEIRKITGSAWLCLILLLAVCCNAVLFALYATGDSRGYTIPQLQEAFRQEDLPAYQEELWQQLQQAAQEATWSHYDALRSQLAAADAAWERTQQAVGYQEFRAALVAEARLKLQLGLFDGFAARSLQQGIAVYETLEDTSPQPVFLGGAELLLSFRFSDALALLFPLLSGLMLLTHERAAGLVQLSRPARYGRFRLYGRKLAAAAVLSAAGFAALYGVNVLVAGLLYGLGDMDVPVQSLYGFAACPYHLTVGQLLLFWAAGKLLWLLCCTVGILALCAWRKHIALVVAPVAACIGISAVMAESSQLWLRNLSLWQLADGQELFREAICLNLAGHPVDRVVCGAVFLLLLMLLSAVAGGLLYSHTPRGARSRRLLSITFPRPRHTRLLVHELYKALVLQGGLGIVLVFLVVMALIYGRFTPPYSEFEAYYRNYSAVLAGAPNKEKDAYLASEKARFEALNDQLLQLLIRYPDGTDFNGEIEAVQDQLRAQEAFHMAWNQYHQLRPGQTYLYQTGYQRLLGPDALRQNLLELGGAFLTMALLLSGTFAGERSCGMDALLCASPRRREVIRCKAFLAALYALALTWILWLPGLLTVQEAYGALDMAAQANSVQCLSLLPDAWTIDGVLAALLLGRLILLLAAAAVVMMLSYRCGTVSTLLLSQLLLLVPTGAAYVLV